MKKNLLYVFSFTVFALVSCGGKWTYEEFDSNKWKYSDFRLEENWSLRWDMMNSLRNEHDLAHKSKQEILQLLGKDGNDVKQNQFTYSLGMTHHGINSGILYIVFDDHDQVKQFYVLES